MFFGLNNYNININKIREISIAREDAVRIIFDDGSSHNYSTYGDASQTISRLKDTVIQIIPCTSTLYNVFKEDDDSYFYELVPSLALCADGLVRSLSSPEFLCLADSASNFVACVDEDGLKNYIKKSNCEVAPD